MSNSFDYSILFVLFKKKKIRIRKINQAGRLLNSCYHSMTPTTIRINTYLDDSSMRFIILSRHLKWKVNLYCGGRQTCQTLETKSNKTELAIDLENHIFFFGFYLVRKGKVEIYFVSIYSCLEFQFYTYHLF